MDTTLSSPYPSDDSDDEWAFAAPYLTRIGPDARQDHQPLDACKYIIRCGGS